MYNSVALKDLPVCEFDIDGIIQNVLLCLASSM